MVSIRGYAEGDMAVKWTAVEDGLPEEYETVDVRQRGYAHALIGKYGDGEWHTSDGVGGYTYFTEDVTHWKPRPDLPELGV